jgi:signal transduction histidine kinase/ligand-binding sensor domain-containing protein
MKASDKIIKIIECKCNLRLLHFKINHAFLFFVSVLCLLLLISGARPQEEIPQPQNYHQWGAVTLFNGLPSENVRAVAQTPDGILWFGTQNGLARFNGRLVENVNLEGAASSGILALAIDSGGTLWIGTEAGAGRFIKDKFTPIEETRGRPIRAILIGETEILVSPDAIFKFHHKPDNSLEIVQSTARNLQFTGAARTADGNLFFSSRGHGILVEENSEILETNSRPRPFFVNALHSESDGNLWFGAQADESSSGLFFAGNFARPERVGENLGTVTAIAESESGDLWVGTEKSGLFHFQNRRLLNHYTFENTAGGLRSDSIYTLFIDREGVVWIGTNRGACRFDSASPFSQSLSESGNSNFVRVLYKSSGNQLYAGTNRGLFVEREENWVEAKNFSSKVVYDITENPSKQLLISTANGLFGFDGKQILAGDARGAVNFQGKTYAAIFGRGVLQIENQTPIFANDSTTALYADDKNLWIGTAKDGVFVFDGKETKQEKSLESLSRAAIRKIVKENENTFWFSGEAGLFRFENGELQALISNQDVRDVSINGDDIWAATLKGGLFHLKFDRSLGWMSSDINVEQGLPSEQIFSILPIGNHLLIGTNRGIVNYAPSVVAPQIVATRVLSQRLFSQKEISRPINLDYPQNSLLLEVAGLSSRTFPEQFQYGFLLKNKTGVILDKKLSNDAQFSPENLPPGAYRIEARSFNKDLLASEPLVLEFTVARAPFPLTATALGVLLAAALIGLIWAMIERRRINLRNRELAAARFDLANEAERERKRIAQDLHDQTLADLRSLMLMSDKSPLDAKNFRGEIEAVSTEIRRICEDLSPSVLENVGLIAALEFLLGQTIENYKFSADEGLEEQINFTSNVQMQIYRIAQEILTNIKHHSDASFVRMEIGMSAENEFVLTIEDDGSVFNPEKIASKGRGIVNIKSRAALLKADIFWRKSETEGTIFQLKKTI